MMESQADRVMELSEWEERWYQNRTGFHKLVVHQMLENYLDKVLGGRKAVRFFFPLCGKAVDMKWLADMGHSVVGVEISEKGIKQFFEENNLTYSEEPVTAIPGARVYKSDEKKISLYQCDLYRFSSSVEGQFGAIWDRGSLVAINPRDREKYASLIISLMDKDCRYLLDTLLYNPELYKGPPFFVPDEQLHTLFGSSCDIELLQSADAFEERHRDWGITSLTEHVHLITPNMMESQADQVVTLSEWEERWHQNRTIFHNPVVHQMLENNLDKVLGGRKAVRFFFPLCGKAVDMKWLADMGHSVVGVEISEKGIKQFFEENNLTYSEEPVTAIPGARVYKSAEKKISLYQCDQYRFSSSVEGQFGAIWDRGSLVAINPRDREKYASLIISLMDKDCRYLLDTLLYNPELYKGPPFVVPDEEVHTLFGSSCDIELLQSADAFEERHRALGINSVTEHVHLITPKCD